VSAVTCIAVVDDEASVRTMLGRVLRLADYDVAAFSSGEDFLASLATRRPDCLVLDVHMPGLSGFDVMSRMCAVRDSVPVVFITASDDVGLDQAVLAAGGTKLLRKPFSSNDLLDAVAQALRRKPREAS
jgi:FixJ family two-component response regulator